MSTDDNKIDDSTLTKKEIIDILDDGNVYTLSDGRKLGYLLFGDTKSKKHVVFCNGSPASRLEAKVYKDQFQDAGVCGICFDRHGYGKSDFPHPPEKASLLQYAHDMDEVLTNGLQIERYHVIGASAGGINALALMQVAAAQKVRRGALISPIGPIYETGTQGMAGFFRFFLFLGIYTPSVVGFLLRSMMVGNKEKMIQDPSHLDKMDDGFVQHVGGSDVEYLKSMDRRKRLFYPLSSAEAFSQGESGVNHLNTILTQPWGFDIRDILIPVDVFASHDDDMVPLSMADYIAKQLQNSKTHWYKGERHTSFIGRKMKDALSAVLA